MSGTRIQRVLPTAFDSRPGSGGEIELHLYTRATDDSNWTIEEVTHVIDLTPATVVELIRELEFALVSTGGHAA